VITTVGPLYISIHIYIIQVNDQKKVAVFDATLSLRRVNAFVACEKLAANQRVASRQSRRLAAIGHEFFYKIRYSPRVISEYYEHYKTTQHYEYYEAETSHESKDESSLNVSVLQINNNT